MEDSNFRNMHVHWSISDSTEHAEFVASSGDVEVAYTLQSPYGSEEASLRTVTRFLPQTGPCEAATFSLLCVMLCGVAIPV